MALNSDRYCVFIFMIQFLQLWFDDVDIIIVYLSCICFDALVFTIVAWWCWYYYCDWFCVFHLMMMLFQLLQSEAIDWLVTFFDFFNHTYKQLAGCSDFVDNMSKIINVSKKFVLIYFKYLYFIQFNYYFISIFILFQKLMKLINSNFFKEIYASTLSRSMVNAPCLNWTLICKHCLKPLEGCRPPAPMFTNLAQECELHHYLMQLAWVLQRPSLRASQTLIRT